MVEPFEPKTLGRAQTELRQDVASPIPLLEKGLVSSAYSIATSFKYGPGGEGGFEEGDSELAASAFLTLLAINKGETDFNENT